MTWTPPPPPLQVRYVGTPAAGEGAPLSSRNERFIDYGPVEAVAYARFAASIGDAAAIVAVKIKHGGQAYNLRGAGCDDIAFENVRRDTDGDDPYLPTHLDPSRTHSE